MTRTIWRLKPPAPSSSTRERLLDAAAMLFYDQGFHAVGLDQILAEVGVTKTTFYNHFQSKDDLIVAVLEHRDRIDMGALAYELQRRAADPRARILTVFEILGEWFEDPDFRGCLFINASAQFPNPNDPVHIAASRHSENLFRVFAGLLAELGCADPPSVAKQLCMIVGAAILSRHVDGDGSAALTARQMAEAVLDRHLPIGI